MSHLTDSELAVLRLIADAHFDGQATARLTAHVPPQTWVGTDVQAFRDIDEARRCAAALLSAAAWAERHEVQP